MLKGLKNKIKKLFVNSNKSYSLNEIDLKLEPYLSEIRNGFFIEAGANDGIRQSNTLYYEKKYGWKGLLVEAIPELAKKAKKNRPKDIVENFALVSESYDKPTIVMKYGDLMSIVSGTESSDHMGWIKDRVQTYDIEVPVSTLTSILNKNNVKKVDFISLDLEGYELEALRGFDFTIWKPKYLLIEARDKNETDNFMKNVGYKETAQLSHHDYLYEYE
jgi:FkbM family methyltransferase